MPPQREAMIVNQSIWHLAKIWKKNGYNYNILRFDGNAHIIASAFLQTYPEQIRFLETNVIKGDKRVVEALIADPAIPEDKLLSLDQLYKDN